MANNLIPARESESALKIGLDQVGGTVGSIVLQAGSGADTRPWPTVREQAPTEVRRIAWSFLHRVAITPDASLTVGQLCRLLYYSEGFSLAIHKRSIFPDEIVALASGVGIPAISHDYGAHGAEIYSITTSHSIELTDEVEEIVAEVWSVYGQFAAWRLRELVHEDRPWQRAWERADRKVSRSDMAEYFAMLVKGAQP